MKHDDPIALIEDDPNDAFFVRRALQRARIMNQLQVFETASAARQQFTALPFAWQTPVLFIVDLHLPGGETGLEFLAWLRQQPKPLGATGALVLTGSRSELDREKSRQLGTMAYLEKPITDVVLTSAVLALGFEIVPGTEGESYLRLVSRRER